MVLLLPTVPVRLCVIVVSIVLVAIVNSFAIFGWCVSPRVCAVFPAAQ